MITLTYIDAYQTERTVQYENMDAFLLALSGCVTIPDHYQVTSVTENGETIPFQGRISELYQSMFTFQKQDT
ncbi:DUF4649 family protein [Streptococcus himalayensis]|uniref:DUF4649 domain-containing protein n=1 Tax=Streptococcus himalayensis TaxID=1888195 RepID=A0A917EFF6_9STRE|nr:DUF4649 family protein [Streptococcus himalayensis]GGE33238.1 DUF4649 domain-containing protein [Streptococcus himalayensis]